MKIIITESELIKLVNRVITESNYNETMDDETIKYVSDLVESYLESGAIKTYFMHDYLVVDFETPTFFASVGFPYNDVQYIKGKLRRKGFLSLGDGKYVRKYR